MATYSPPDFPRRPKHSTLFSELRYSIQLNYYRYQINTALYVMSPAEKLAYNLIVLSFLVLFLSAVYYCLPSAIYLSINRIAYYCTGSSKLYVAGIHGAADVVHSSRVAVASLIGSSREAFNASRAFTRLG